MSDARVRRAYHSPARAEKARQTRRRIRATAKRLFLRDGYLATSMKTIAAEASVAERTLYLAFPTKAALLNEIIRVTVRGHDRDEPLLAGAAFQSVLLAPAGELIAGFAEASTALMARTARVLAIGEAAATVDPALAEFRDRGHAATRSDIGEVAAALHQRGELAARVTVKQATDILFSLAANEALYLRLVDECGWTDSDYARFLERLLASLLT
jgi:TetR/AcrR family transcriptional regulator of autoinduction and epiphytic fitness